MIRKALALARQLAHAASLGVLLAAAQPVFAGPIVFDTFLQFSFDINSSPAVAGCAPDDPDGNFCLASSGTPTGFLDAPPWTFVAPAAGAKLTVIDVFESGDVFEVFDFGSLIGSTSVPVANVDCGDDPVACLATAGMSFGVFALSAGAHSLTMTVAQAPSDSGSGYLQVAAVPEPATLALVLGALAAAWVSHRRQAASGRRTA